MEFSTNNLVINADSTTDMQMHTTFSDGTWAPDDLLAYLASHHFSVVAITDHDRVDTAVTLQQLALEKHMPVLVAAEMSTTWRGQYVDTLCFGFDPDNSELRALTATIVAQQREITCKAYEYLLAKGYPLADGPNTLESILSLPATRHPHALAAVVQQAKPELDRAGVWAIIEAGGVRFATNPIADVAEVIHASGGVCLIAHPGRGQFYPIFDPALLDAIRAEAPLDGFEAYYPLHSAEQTAMYVEYAARYNLLTSSGSDSHGTNRDPIAYPAGNSRKLLERLGVHVSE